MSAHEFKCDWCRDTGIDPGYDGPCSECSKADAIDRAWNAAIEAAAKVAEECPYYGNLHASAIRALRRNREGTEAPLKKRLCACDTDPIGMERCDYCDPGGERA